MTSDHEQEQNDPRVAVAEIYREQVLMAGYGLLSGLDDITSHHGGETLRFWIEHYGTGSTVENLTGIAEAAQRLAATALEQLQQAGAGRDWMASDLPKRCANCGHSIHVERDEWRICRQQPEHTWCHRPNATDADEDSDRNVHDRVRSRDHGRDSDRTRPGEGRGMADLGTVHPRSSHSRAEGRAGRPPRARSVYPRPFGYWVWR